MSGVRRTLLSFPIGGCIAVVGFAFSVSNTYLLTPIGLALNWHLVLIAWFLLPAMNPELTKTGVIVWGMLLPFLEWWLITLATMHFLSGPRKT